MFSRRHDGQPLSWAHLPISTLRVFGTGVACSGTWAQPSCRREGQTGVASSRGVWTAPLSGLATIAGTCVRGYFDGIDTVQVKLHAGHLSLPINSVKQSAVRQWQPRTAQLDALPVDQQVDLSMGQPDTQPKMAQNNRAKPTKRQQARPDLTDDAAKGESGNADFLAAVGLVVGIGVGIGVACAWQSTPRNNAATVSVPIPTADTPVSNFAVGDRVKVKGKGGAGTVRFVGLHHIEGTPRLGVQLDVRHG